MFAWGVTSLPLGDSRQTCHQCQGSATKILNQDPSVENVSAAAAADEYGKKGVGKGFRAFRLIFRRISKRRKF